MDEEKGIKEFSPDLFQVLRKSKLHRTLFNVKDKKAGGVSAFVADPSAGYIAFPRYSESEGDTDAIIGTILQGN